MNRRQINTLKLRMLSAITTNVSSDYEERLQCKSIRIIIFDEKGFIASICQFDIVDCMTKKGDPKKFILQIFNGLENNKYSVEPVSLCSR